MQKHVQSIKPHVCFPGLLSTPTLQQTDLPRSACGPNTRPANHISERPLIHWLRSQSDELVGAQVVTQGEEEGKKRHDDQQ